MPEIVFSQPTSGVSTNKNLERDRKRGSHASSGGVHSQDNPMLKGAAPRTEGQLPLELSSSFGQGKSFIAGGLAEKVDSLDIGSPSLAEMASRLL